MSHPLAKFSDLDSLQIKGMIAHTQRQYPYLEFSSMDGVLLLCELMIKTTFMLDTKSTPIRASFDFLRAVASPSQEGLPESRLPFQFAERDMVFAIKMFGLRIRITKGLYQFVPDNRMSDNEDEEFIISDSISTKKLEFYLSGVQKLTKNQTHAIQSLYNKLLREYRELELAKLFSEKLNKDKWSIGDAREYLRDHCGIKDHEFVRIRKKAIDHFGFQSRRSTSKTNRRVTLDEDVGQYVDQMIELSGGRTPLTASQMVNRLLRDFQRFAADAAAAAKNAKG